MKTAILAALILVALPSSHAEKLKAFAVIRLDALPSDAGSCQAKWRTSSNRLLWIDEGHLAVQRLQYCSSQEPKKSQPSIELILLDTHGHLSSIRREEMFGPLRGPGGTLLVSHGSQVDLLALDLQPRQTISCPVAQQRCAVYVPAMLNADSDFAVCSVSADREECRFYRGFPPVEIPQSAASIAIPSGIPHTPYQELSYPGMEKISPQDRSVWKVSSSEIWYFDSENRLMSLESGGNMAPVVSEEWTPKGTNCTGELSASQPHRFLATCIGAHIYTDGDLDALFGYSRIAVFDTASRRILARINGRAYTWAALSPEGKQVAVLHDGKVSFYRVS